MTDVKQPEEKTEYELHEHQREAIDRLETESTGNMEFPTRTFPSGMGKAGSNTLHKAGQKLVDGLIARYGKEGAQRILEQRIMQARARNLKMNPVAGAVRQVCSESANLALQAEADRISTYLRRSMLKQRLMANPALIEDMKKAVDVDELRSVIEEIESLNPNTVDGRSTMHLTVGDESFEPTPSDLDRIKETFEEADEPEAAGDLNYALPVDMDDDIYKGVDAVSKGPHKLDSDVDAFDIDNLDIPEVDIEYQEDDGNSDCGDSCTI